MVTFGLFLLALVGVIGGMDDRGVRQRHPSLNPTGWRDDASDAAVGTVQQSVSQRVG